MITQSHDSASLIDFTANPDSLLEKLKSHGRPVILTVEGKPDVIVQDATSYHAMIDRLETIAALKEGLADIQAGRHIDMREAMAEIAKRHNLESPLR